MNPIRFKILTAGICCCLLGYVAVKSFEARHQFNVVLVTLDTTRADHLACYGYQHGVTPAMDQLAENGVVFERAYCPVPLTLPSHTSMLTGLYPPEHGLHVNGMGRLAADIPSLPEILKGRNYDTGAFLSAFVLNSKFGLSRGFDTYDDDLSRTDPGDSFMNRRRDGKSVMDVALKWLGQRVNRPFFCWVHLYDAHDPYDSRPSLYADRFADRPYDAGIATEDTQIARLIEFLKAHGLQGRTLVIIAGDHGEGLSEHNEHEHGMQLYDTTVRVPLIVSGPNSIKRGHRVSTAVSLVDLMPTVLDCLSIPQKPHTNGRSLKPFLAGEKLESRACYVETDAPLDHHWAPLRALITDRYKYIRTTREELYDLRNDPGELHDRNLVDAQMTKECSDTLDDLQATFQIRETGSVHLTSKERNVLASLGYTGGIKVAAAVTSNPRLPDVKDMMPAYNVYCEVKDCLAVGEVLRAMEKLEETLRLAPDFASAKILLGDVLVGQKKYAEAASAYQEVLDRHSEHPTALAHFADVLTLQGKLDDAVPYYRRAVKLDQDSATWHLHLAQVLGTLGQIKEATIEFESAIRCDPGFIRGRLEYGRFLLETGRHEQSMGQFEAVLKLSPESTVAHLNLGAALARARRNSESISHLQKAVELEPDRFEARFNYGTVLMIEQRFQEAITQFEAAIRLRPDDPRPGEQLERAKRALNTSLP